MSASHARLGLIATLLVGAFLTSTSRAEAEETPKPTGSVYTADGLLGSMRTGPTFGFGVPDGLRFGAFAKWRGLLAGGAALSLLPETQIPGLDGSIMRASGEAFLRVHPFRGAFFLGVAGGYAQTKGTMSDERTAFQKTQQVEAHAYVSAVYVAPHVGFQWMLPIGLTMGFDVGVEIPVVASEPSFDAARNGQVVNVDGKGAAADAGRYVASSPVPVIHLLELGYAL